MSCGFAQFRVHEEQAKPVNWRKTVGFSPNSSKDKEFLAFLIIKTLDLLSKRGYILID